MSKTTRSLKGLILFVVVPLAMGCQKDPLDPVEDLDARPDAYAYGGGNGEQLPGEPPRLLIIPKDLVIAVGEEAAFERIWEDDDDNYDAPDKIVAWVSSDPDVARVNHEGLVQGLKPGTATIHATAESGTATATVTVVSR
jgi:hypothetical protein